MDPDADLLDEIEEAFRHSPQLFSVRTAGNGRIATKMFHEFQPHVVVLNASMPSPGGLELCRHIRKSAQAQHTHIVALLRRSDQKLIGLANDYGIDVCLNRAADSETIKYEVWRLAQESDRAGIRAVTGVNYRALREATRKHTQSFQAPTG